MDCCSKKAYLKAPCNKDYVKGIAREDDSDIDTNIISLKFNDLQQKEANIFIGDPFYCQNCKSILSSMSMVCDKEAYLKICATETHPIGMDLEESKLDEKQFKIVWNKINPDALMNLSSNAKIWICEFCGNINILNVEKEEVPIENDVIYLIKSFNQIKHQSESQNLSSEETVIFCLDNSGSMGETHKVKIPQENGETKKKYISRKDCVLKAVDTQLKEMATIFPNRKVGLVIFNSYVEIIGDAQSSALNITDKQLNDFHFCLNKGIQGTETLLSSTVSKSSSIISEKLSKLYVSGSTALGPGLLAAIGLAYNGKPGSVIVICTDGQANLGVGDLQSNQEDSFYQEAGLLAKEKGIIINIITIKGAGCRVDKLCILAEMTGGTVTRVNPEKLESDFSKALGEELVARDTRVKIQLHEGLKFRNESAEFLNNSLSVYQKDHGNITASTELTFEYQLKSNEELTEFGLNLNVMKEIPFQSHILYTSISGDKLLRVITKKLETTQSLEEAGKNANMKLLAARVAHITSNQAEAGNLIEAKSINKKWDKFLTKTAEETNKGNEDIERYFRHYKEKNQKLIKALDKNVKRKLKNHSSDIQKDIDNLSEANRRSLASSLEALSDSGSEDEGVVDYRRFRKIRSRSYSRSPVRSIKSRSNSSSRQSSRSISRSGSRSSRKNRIRRISIDSLSRSPRSISRTSRSSSRSKSPPYKANNKFKNKRRGRNKNSLSNSRSRSRSIS